MTEHELLAAAEELLELSSNSLDAANATVHALQSIAASQLISAREVIRRYGNPGPTPRPKPNPTGPGPR